MAVKSAKSIVEIEVKNFKSFKHLKIELDNLCVLIGANAAGKSNFIQIFKFIRDLSTSGLENAIAMQGGAKYLCNGKIGFSENFELKIKCNTAVVIPMVVSESSEKDDSSYQFLSASAKSYTYHFAIKFDKNNKYKIIEDRLTIFFEEFRSLDQKELSEKISGEISIFRKEDKIETTSLKWKDSSQIVRPLFFIEPIKNDSGLLIEFSRLFEFKSVLANISIYDFDPKLPKLAVPFTGKTELEGNGQNLAIVLDKISKDEDKKRAFCNLISDLIPFIDNIDVKKYADKFMLLTVRETFDKKNYLPASILSDGTINIASLIIALYFESKPFIVIEEPERNIHPFLLSKVVNMIQESSRERQIMVTTHNPEIIRQLDLDNILFISRSKEGFSTVANPKNNKQLNKFLKEIGIEQLFLQNLLDISNG